MPNHVDSVKSASPKKEESHGHDFYGEDLARPLIAWLNSGGDQLPGVSGLLEIAGRYHEAQARKSKPAALLMRLLKEKATAILTDYRFTPVVDEMNDRWHIEWMALADHTGEAPFVLRLLDLAEIGKIHSIRRCAREDCRRWFFARYGHQRFHSGECQIAVLQADPVRKAQRAKHMRWLRQWKKLRSRRGRK
jgi:hypothetical protein